MIGLARVPARPNSAMASEMTDRWSRLSANVRLWISLPLSALLAVGCTPVASVEPPPGWRQVDVGDFSFHVPPDMKAVSSQGIDSVVGQYRSDSLSVGFDYGMNSDPLNDRQSSGYRSRYERIGGKRAKIVSYHASGAQDSFRHAIAAHFPEVNGNRKLTVHARCKTANDCETASTLLRTIEFD